MKFKRIIIQLLLLLYSGISLSQIKSINISNDQIDKEVEVFLEAINEYTGPPIETLSLKDARQSYIDLQAGEILKPDCLMEIHQITHLGQKVKVTIVKPKNSIALLPALIYFHGGGWVLGGLDTHERLIKIIAVKAQVAVVFVHYSLSPEVKYPIALEEGYAVTDWLAMNGKEVGVDSKKIAIGGDSVGGNMATVISILAKERKGPKIGFQLLFYPVTNTSLNDESFQKYGSRYYLTKSAMKWFWEAYLPKSQDGNSYKIAPLKASKKQLSGLPPALVITAEYDVLRNQGEAYAKKMKAAGVVVKTTRYMGTIHDFVMLNYLADTEISKKAIDEATNAIRNLFYYKKKINGEIN
ncbi:MAG: hypothetical protein COA88_02785 [Kordia sp.]|nr:MAG: hypothetical protein COA88_02785 [Kordia sp.]